MKSHEAIGVVLGVLGFLLGCYNLWRAILSAGEARNLAYAQTKREALGLITEGEAAYLAVKRQLRDLRDEAQDESLQHVVNQANEFVIAGETQAKMLGGARAAIRAARSKGKSHIEQLRFVEEQVAQIEDLTHAKKIEEEAQEFIQPARRAIALAKRARDA